jgi:hypothetical protein
MTVNLKERAARFMCLMVILTSLAYVGGCFADMPNPGPQKHEVEIQGAKIISEGGYLWFHVINHDNRQLYVAIHYPSDAILIGTFPTVVFLKTGEKADFYFQVPYYWSKSAILIQQNSTKTLKFYFEIYTLYHGEKTTDENVEFDVNAIPLTRVYPLDLFFFAIFIAAAVVIAVVIIALRKNRKETKSH